MRAASMHSMLIARLLLPRKALVQYVEQALMQTLIVFSLARCELLTLPCHPTVVFFILLLHLDKNIT